MRPTLFSLLLLALPLGAQEDLGQLAKNVRDYRTKFELIGRGRAAVPYLMAQVEHEDRWIAFESKSAVRWIVIPSFVISPRLSTLVSRPLTLVPRLLSCPLTLVS